MSYDRADRRRPGHNSSVNNMQFSEAVGYLYSRLPVYHRVGPKALKPGLTNTRRLCEGLGDPHRKFQSIHVGGTNGKGSTAHMLAAVYQAAGYRVGLYTSPHLKSFTERIRVNGQPIAEDAVAAFVTRHQSLIETIEPSFFEVSVAMAFDYFAQSVVDIAIVEVGLGGRLDSTNVIMPLMSVITNIGYDHTDILGDTLPAIAAEKAGIIKPGVPVVISETQAETAPVFSKKAADEQSPILFADTRYTILNDGLVDGLRQVRVVRDGMPAISLDLALAGIYQLRNLPGVLAAVDGLQPLLPVADADIRYGLKSVVALTGLLGRFQQLAHSPDVIADTAHNEPGLQALMETVASMDFTRLHIVMGVVSDKPAEPLLAVLPRQAVYYFCQADSPRALPAMLLQSEGYMAGRIGESYADVNAALAAACDEATPTDLILITGSNYVVAELTDL